MKKHPLVLVEWHDAAVLDRNSLAWLSKEECLETAYNKYKYVNRTVGFLLEKKRNYIVIAATDGDEVYSDGSMIPTGLISKIKKL